MAHGKPGTKIEQLTTLRFFAAMMIVIHHSYDLLGIENISINLGQGVSFFFVLSGFVLTYVYPKLDTWLEIKLFWRARIARIYPAYIVVTLLGFLLLHYGWRNNTGLSFLFMVQAWIPDSTYYFSYNAVCWSISAELFFYLLFPFIPKSRNKCMLALLFSSVILIAILIASNLLSIPEYIAPGDSHNLIITTHGLIYINPVSRIFEFIVGMIVATLLQTPQTKLPTRGSILLATIYELGAIILCIVSTCYMNFIAWWGGQLILGAPLGLWLSHSGSVFVYGFLIFILAQGKGKISKILAISPLVLLGEVSFSLYLIHQILLNYYRINSNYFWHFPTPAPFIIFIVIALFLSYIIFISVEKPGRELIRNRKKLITPIVQSRVAQSPFSINT